MNLPNGRTRNGVLLALALGLGLGACDDASTGIEDPHFEPVTLQVVLGGQVLATAQSIGGAVTGQLTVAVGEETPHLDIRFLDENGNVTEPDDDVSLQVVVLDEGIAGFEQDTPGEFGGHLHGESVGETTLRFSVIHGDHADWISADVPAVVGASGS